MGNKKFFYKITLIKYSNYEVYVALIVTLKGCVVISTSIQEAIVQIQKKVEQWKVEQKKLKMKIPDNDFKNEKTTLISDRLEVLLHSKQIKQFWKKYLT